MANRGHNAAVKDGKLLHVSVSQIKDFLRCPRLWYSAKVLGIQRPFSKAAEKGVNHHAAVERWYRGGPRPSNEAFEAAIAGLPAPAKDLLVEEPLTNPVLYIEETRFDGYCDLIVPPREDGIPYIIDHKFVSSFRYMDDPANSLQTLIYGYHASKRWPETWEVKLGFHYYMADGSDFKQRVATVPVERCESEWTEIVIPTVHKMQAFVAQGHVEGWELTGVPDNRGDPCYQFGGCFLMEQCGVVPKGKADREIRAALKMFDSGT